MGNAGGWRGGMEARLRNGTISIIQIDRYSSHRSNAMHESHDLLAFLLPLSIFIAYLTGFLSVPFG